MSIRDRHGRVARAYRWLLGRARGTPTALSEVDEKLGRHMRLLDAIRTVPEPYRSALFQCRILGRKPRQVARRLHVPVETVEARVRHALRLVAERIDRAAS